MQAIVTLQSFGALLVLLIVVASVRGQNASPVSILVGSLVLVGVAISHLYFSDTMDLIVELLLNHGKLQKDAAQATKSTISIWNIIVPMVVGGLGINMFSGWVTAVAPK